MELELFGELRGLELPKGVISKIIPFADYYFCENSTYNAFGTCNHNTKSGDLVYTKHGYWYCSIKCGERRNWR